MTPSRPTSPASRLQHAVLSWLGGRGPSESIKRIDTHASVLFLEPDRVLKIKRAVRFPFLDYSTLEKRRHACEEELRINRGYAPRIYRRVVPITQSAGNYQIGGDGDAVEWAVEMARFDENRTLDHLARSGEFDAALGDTIADVLLESHRHAEVSDGTNWIASLRPIIDRNTTKFRAQPLLPPGQVERLHHLSQEKLQAGWNVLQKRASAGMVRRCHGDAHLGNIILIDGQPVLFDAIEFDPVIATTDTLYDLAFPLMDCVYFDLVEAANRMLNRYVQRTWEENGEALSLLPLFLSMRAAIRSHVAWTRSEQSSDPSPAEEAQRYFRLALWLLRPAPPVLIAIGGKSGTGKSTLAKGLAASIGAPPGALVLRSDIIRKEMFGRDPLVALPEEAYSSENNTRVYNLLMERGRQILRQGHSVIIDAAFLTEDEREEVSALAQQAGAEFHPVFLAAGIGDRLSRIESRHHDASDADREVAIRQEQRDVGHLNWPVIDSSGSREDTLKQSKAVVKHVLNDPRK